jgi:hypothetical protein
MEHGPFRVASSNATTRGNVFALFVGETTNQATQSGENAITLRLCEKRTRKPRLMFCNALAYRPFHLFNDGDLTSRGLGSFELFTAIPFEQKKFDVFSDNS